jgi:ubiquinone/menaquinone biosynthesis C-methylase UbiE
MTRPAADVIEIKHEERRWQDAEGGLLQQQAYERAGTRFVLEQQFARVARALRLERRHRVLDLGCGVGNFLAWLSRREPASLHGLDLAVKSLEIARRTAAKLDLTAGDAESLPYRDGAFDRVVCNGAAHHLLNPDVAFREIFRVLSPGGLLVMYEPTATAVTTALRKLVIGYDKYESPADLAHKEEFTPAHAVALLSEAGFSGISTSLHDCLAYPLSGSYMRSPLSGSAPIMKTLWRLEQAVTALPMTTPLWNLFAWRLLVVAAKPHA